MFLWLLGTWGAGAKLPKPGGGPHQRWRVVGKAQLELLAVNLKWVCPEVGSARICCILKEKKDEDHGIWD